MVFLYSRTFFHEFCDIIHDNNGEVFDTITSFHKYPQNDLAAKVLYLNGMRIFHGAQWVTLVLLTIKT